MPSRRTPPSCACGATYDAFRINVSFSDAHRMMRVGGDDPKLWRQTRRHSVLGFIRQLKLQAWDYAHGYCEALCQL